MTRIRSIRTRVRPVAVWLAVVLALAAVAGAQDDGAWTGTWEGTIEVPGTPLDVRVHLAADEGEPRGTIDIPAQGATGLDLRDVRIEGREVTFAIAGAGGDPTFEGSLEGGVIAGTFTQGGQSFPFALERSTGEANGASTSAPGEADARSDAAGEGDGANGEDGGGGGTPVPATPGPAAQETADVSRTFEDPEGRYSVPVPTNWSVEEREGHVTLTGPEDGITVHAMALPGDDLQETLAEAWTRADPDFDLEIERTDEPPATGGVERTVQVTYETSDDRVVQGIAQLHEGTAYVLLVDADLAAAQRRQSQIAIIVSGFEIAAIEEDDLTGETPREFTEDRLAEFEAYVADALERFDVPGAAVALVQDGRIVYTGGFGTAGPDGADVTPETLMMIGSTTKTMTTLMMATLVDDGRMDWSTPVVDVLPQFEVADPELTGSITLENLVCACTGVPRRDLELFFEAEGLDAEGVVRSLSDFEFFTDFGEAFQYSNQMVATGGYAAAAAGGAEFGRLYEGYVDLMQDRVLGPIGLPYSTFSFAEVLETEDRATPYGFTRDLTYEPIPLTLEEFVTPIAPAGALWSNTIDMGRYLVTLMNDGVAPDGRRVVSAEELHRTWEPQVPISADASYGLGWIVDEYKGLQQLHHGGNTLGFTSDLAFLPEAGIGVSVLTNGRITTPFNEAVRVRAFELAYGLEAEYDEQAMFMHEQLRTALGTALEDAQEQVDPEAVAPWEGLYVSPALGEVEFRLEEGRLVLDADGFRTDVLPTDEEGRYVATDDPALGLPVRLSEDDAGEPVLILGEGAVQYTFERVD